MRTAKRFDEFLQRLAAAAVPKRRTWMKPDMRAVDSVRLLAELVPQWRLSIQTRAPAARGSHTVWLNAKHVRSFELCECFRWAVDCATPLRLAEVIAGPLSLLLGAQRTTCNMRSGEGHLVGLLLGPRGRSLAEPAAVLAAPRCCGLEARCA